MGVNSTHNTIGENVGAYNTVLALLCQGGCKALFLQVYRVWSPVLWFDLCALPYFLRLFPGPYRASVPGRLVPVGSECASWRRAVCRGLVHPQLETRVGVGSSALARPSGRRGRPEAGWRPKRALRSERWAGVGSGRRSSSARPSGRKLDRPSGLSFRYLGRPRSCASFATLSTGPSLLLGSWSMRDPGFMNPTGAPEPPGDSCRIV